ncbi:MAG: YciI family protein [Methanospirillum sp.]
MDPPLTNISTMKPTRTGFLSTMTPEERGVMEQHFAYVQRLFDQGKLLLGGAATDGAIEVLVYRVDSADEARRFFDEDPAAKAAIDRSELHPFRVGLLLGS